MLDSRTAPNCIDYILKSQKKGVADGHDLRAFVLGNRIPDEFEMLRLDAFKECAIASGCILTQRVGPLGCARSDHVGKNQRQRFGRSCNDVYLMRIQCLVLQGHSPVVQ